MKVGIIGASGRLGGTLLKILKTRNEVIECNSPECNREVIEKADLTFLCTPLNESVKIISHFSTDGTIVEVGSIKAPLVKFQGRIISIHPLFGPMTYSDSAYRRILFIENISADGSYELIRSLFPEYEIIGMSSWEHDALMSRQLVLPYIISIISRHYQTSEEITLSRSLLNRVIAISRNENEEVLMDTIRLNPYTREILDTLANEISRIGGMINDLHP